VVSGVFFFCSPGSRARLLVPQAAIGLGFYVASRDFISPDGVEGFDFEGGIDEGDLSPTKKTKIKRGNTTPPRHKLPILFF
jgi:hypothetical protein